MDEIMGLAEFWTPQKVGEQWGVKFPICTANDGVADDEEIEWFPSLADAEVFVEVFVVSTYPER